MSVAMIAPHLIDKTHKNICEQYRSQYPISESVSALRCQARNASPSNPDSSNNAKGGPLPGRSAFGVVGVEVKLRSEEAAEDRPRVAWRTHLAGARPRLCAEPVDRTLPESNLKRSFTNFCPIRYRIVTDGWPGCSLPGLHPLPGIADNPDRHCAREADVLHAGAGTDDRGVLQDRQHSRHVPQLWLHGIDHVIDVLRALEGGIDVRLNAVIADPGEV